jgi:hypothetical protein
MIEREKSDTILERSIEVLHENFEGYFTALGYLDPWIQRGTDPNKYLEGLSKTMINLGITSLRNSSSHLGITEKES